MKFLADYDSRDLVITDGDGCFVTDKHGKRYLDFVAGWCVGNVGWKRHEVVAALKRQADRGYYVPPFLRSDDWENYAKRLIEFAPGSRLKRAYRATSGSEAVEIAIKCTRAATGKKTVVSIDGVYHGHTYGAASVGNAMTDKMAPGVPGMMKLPLPNQYRGINTADVLSRFEQLLRASDDIAAFISEPVFTNAGVIVPPPDFYPEIQRFCRQRGILVVMDEVATGFGRCGALFASSLWGIEPDILCLGKGLTGGYGTMGATLVSEEIFQASRQLPTYSTFGWNLQDLSAAQSVLDVVTRERLWENAHGMGMYLTERLRQLESRPYVGQVRNAGLLIGVEIVKDKSSKAPDRKRAEEIADTCLREGLLIETSSNVLFMSPPLVLHKELADQGAAILEKVLG